MKKSLVFYYRSTGDDKRPTRPSFYSKLLCLKSFIAAFNKINCKKDLYFINDTEIPEDRLSIMKKYGKIIFTNGLGNGGTNRFIFDQARNEGADYFYFSEDDYLYTENAFLCFIDALESIKTDYVALYDHPDRYADVPTEPDMNLKVYTSKYCHWRLTSTVCMTYGGRMSSFKKDYWIMKLFTQGVDSKDPFLHRIFKLFFNYHPHPRRYCWDETMWHALLGIGRFFFKFPKRKLVSPLPSLITHVDTRGLAPVVGWKKLAEQMK